MNAWAPPLADQRSRNDTELAHAVVRAERALARQASRIAAAPQIRRARYADALAVVALLLPWDSVHNGLQLSGWVASLTLMGIVLRQVVLAAVAAQPDRHGRPMLTVVGTVTALTSIFALVRLPALNLARGWPHGPTHLEVGGPLFYGVAAVAAAAFTVLAGRRLSTGPAPDLLANMYLATPADVQVRLAGVQLAIAQRPADPLPPLGVLGLAVAVAGTQGSWADAHALRWAVGAAMAIVFSLAFTGVRRVVMAMAQVVVGSAALLLTMREIVSITTDFTTAAGAWLTLAGTVVTTLAGAAVLIGRQARRTQRA